MMSAQPQIRHRLYWITWTKNARPEFQAAMDTSVKANDDPLAKIAWLRAPQCTFDLSAAP
jgi:hypothetical protein